MVRPPLHYVEQLGRIGIFRLLAPFAPERAYPPVPPYSGAGHFNSDRQQLGLIEADDTSQTNQAERNDGWNMRHTVGMTSLQFRSRSAPENELYIVHPTRLT